MRLALRVSLNPHPAAWRWYYEDLDLPWPARLIAESADFASWPEAEAAARIAYPAVEEVFVHAVRGAGTAFEDSLPMIPCP